MIILPLGKIVTVTAGTRVLLTADTTIRVHKIVFAQVAGQSGKAAIQSLTPPSTWTELREFGVPSANGLLDKFEIGGGHQSNGLRLSDFAIDSTVNGEGAWVYAEIL